MSLPPMYVIYDHSVDQPEHYVVRCWYSPASMSDAVVVDTVEEARALLPPELVCLGRNPGDDPNILEVWI